MKGAATLTVGLAVAALHGCDRDGASMVPGGDPGRGAELIRHYGCGACHTIPGIPRANANVGPPLQQLRQRVYIAGVMVNTPDNLMRWIQHPQAMDPRTAMPEMGVTAEQARDIAAYLYSR
jgi:cytochrome c2